MGSTVALAFGTIFCVLSLFFVALSFGTDYWIKFSVNQNNLQFASDVVKTAAMKKHYYHSRHRGLFKECPWNDTSIRLVEGVKKADGGCYFLNYEMEDNSASMTYSTDYWARIHLMRSTIGFLIVAMVFLFIGCILGSIACWRTSEKYAKNTGIIIFCGAFFIAFGMAVFHGAEYLEKNKIKDTPEFPGNWDTKLENVTTRLYDWSYIIGWVGVVCAAVSAAIFLVCAWLMSMREKDEKHAHDAYSMRDHGTYGRNRAYEYVDKTALDMYPPQPAVIPAAAYPQPMVTGAYPAPAQAYYTVGPAYDVDNRAYGDYQWDWQRY